VKNLPKLRTDLCERCRITTNTKESVLRKTSKRKEGNSGVEVRNSSHHRHHPWVYILLVKFGFKVSGGGLGLKRRQREILERKEFRICFLLPS
jgi:hypothetical protein